MNINPSTLAPSLLPFLFIHTVYVNWIISEGLSDNIIISGWDLTGYEEGHR